MAIGILYSWGRAAIENYLDKKELAGAITQAKHTLPVALGDPATSEDHRKQSQKELEALELLLVQTEVNRIRLLTNSRQTTATGP